MSQGKDIAIFGGTFNPPHLGHREMLTYLAKTGRFEKILVMPAKIPPHKTGFFAAPEDRLIMCKGAFGGIEGVEVTDFELRLSGKSYTALTLEALREKGIENPTLIIGADSLIDFHKWFRFEDILKMASLCVYHRSGCDDKKLLSAKERLENIGGKITLLDYCPPNISSTKVRELVGNNKSISHLVTLPTNNFILKNKLYFRNDFMEPMFEGTCAKYREKYNKEAELLKTRLTEKRYFHSLSVAKEAVRLAEKYGYDTERAFYAGLMHDVCKDMDPKEQLQLFEQFDIMLDSVEQNAPKLWHAILGAAYLEKVLGVSDEEILKAVRYHTTARANMGLLEKLIYLADFTSEDRDYNGVDSMRKAVDISLEKAMLEALEFSVEDLKAKGCPVHKDTMDAYLEIKE
ncbi:MAG: nicotinate (nicotinamide) nucleotide adenylyltransferase [Clostridia bacterium]|nr:nicotinate (nicotinamide) nucleotide adenylyltransferase [Clostridia bacterium]